MPNSYFQFKQFTIQQDKCAMKVTTDACLFGAWVAGITKSEEPITKSCLDIGTGTGLLALMIAQKNPAMVVDGIEIDKDAFEQASGNVAASPWANRIKIIHADAKEIAAPHKYDIIISNPPFYENEWKSKHANKNIAHHSEDLSLRELLTVIQNHLEPGGSFHLLLPFKRQREIEDLLFQENMAITRMARVRQSVNHTHFRIMLSGQKTTIATGTTVSDIAVKDDKDNYTADFKSWLLDYYLHL